MKLYVKPEFDPEIGVYTAKTNVPGLKIEARTIEEFWAKAQNFSVASKNSRQLNG